MDLDNHFISQFFERLMAENNIEGEVLCCVVIPDYHKLYKHEWQREHLVTRYSMLHMRPPMFKCLCRKEYLNPSWFNVAMNNMDFKIDNDMCQEIKASNLAFIVFDNITAARKIKDLAG